MTYAVKVAYYTLQGEGANAGRSAVFLRFAGCNLWSGREEDRATATCRFCDTDFRGVEGPGGGRFNNAEDLADHVARLWPRMSSTQGPPLVVCTGGEPLLQLDDGLLAALHKRGFSVAIETNGTVPTIPGIDWTCVSPKAGTDLAVLVGDELKLVYPQQGAPPEMFDRLEFTHFFLQPMDGAERESNTERAVAYCLANPQWKLSLQTHKLLGIP